MNERVLLHESGAKLCHGNKITEAQSGIGSLVIESLFIKPLERFPDGMVALMGMAVLIVETRNLMWRHLVNGLGAVKAVRNLEACGRFYESVLATLGQGKLVVRPGTIGFGKKYPEFWLNERRAMTPADPDSGTHICLRASSVEAVQAFHAAAILSEFRQKVEKRGSEPQASTRAEAVALMKSDYERYRKIVKELDIRVE